MVVVEIPIDTTYPEVKELLNRIPKEQQADFVEVLKCFADERGFDWRFCLLLMWGESNIQYKSEEYSSKKKFDSIKEGILFNDSLITLKDIVNMSKTKWRETEWEFPKDDVIKKKKI